MNMSAKQLQRAAEKAKSNFVLYESKAKQAMKAGNIPLARTHGESAMRAKSEAMNYLKLQAQLEGAKSKVAAMGARQAVVGQIAEVTTALDQAMPAGAMDGVAATLEGYAGKVDDLDVMNGVMDGAFAEAGASAAPASEVDDLLRGIAAEHAIDTHIPTPQGMPKAQREQVQQQQASNSRTGYPGQMLP